MKSLVLCLKVLRDSVLFIRSGCVSSQTKFPCLLAVKKVSPLLLLKNFRNFGTERVTSGKSEIKSQDLQEIYQFDSSFFVVSRFVPELPRFTKIGAVNTFLTACTFEFRCTDPQVWNIPRLCWGFCLNEVMSMKRGLTLCYVISRIVITGGIR